VAALSYLIICFINITPLRYIQLTLSIPIPLHLFVVNQSQSVHLPSVIIFLIPLQCARPNTATTTFPSSAEFPTTLSGA